MPIPADFSSVRYLAAKKSVDDRALSRQVFTALVQALRPRQGPVPVAWLEVGCGIGTMMERLWDWGILVNADYTAVDLLPEHIAAAKSRLPDFARDRGLQWKDMGTAWVLASPPRSLTVTLEAVDIFDFAARASGRSAWDVIVAHAFLDLVDLNTALPSLFALLKPGGCFYFTLNFDGATLFLPTLDAAQDALIEKLYHATMDERRVCGRPSGSSQTGRLLFSALPPCGGRILAAGSSDWVVYAGPDGYPADEAYFLHYLVHTVGEALRGHPRLPKEAFQMWISRRRQQIDRRELIYIAHQLDFCGIKEG
jgi:SAM-dependent methyltransferase|uniref:Class I SAM-dependent methyltransferase n=1 Tax=Desulfobacca acetoxidans TaxID=60893 RepID=A0A7V6A4H5_9BACT